MANLDNVLFKHISNSLNIPKNAIYHFTNHANYEKILQDGHLKLHPHKLINEKDPANRELEIATEIIVDQLKLSKMNCLIESFEKIISEGKLTFFTASFSNSRSAMLMNKYGDHTIKINLSYINDHISNNANLRFLFCNVIYSSKTQKRIVRDLFSKYHKLKNCEDDIYSLIKNILLLLPLFKEPTKKNILDNECRLITYSMIDTNGFTSPAPRLTFPIPHEENN